MKIVLFLSVLVGVSSAFAQEETPRPTGEITSLPFFERIFGSRSGTKPSTSGAAKRPGEFETKIYTADEQPDGKRLDSQKVAALAEGVYADQHLYLVGKFLVTAIEGNKAVLRYTDGPRHIRIIVEYSPDQTPASYNQTRTVDTSRRLQLIHVSKVGDDKLNVSAREIAELVK
jgi:hypothetical protein